MADDYPLTVYDRLKEVERDRQAYHRDSPVAPEIQVASFLDRARALAHEATSLSRYVGSNNTDVHKIENYSTSIQANLGAAADSAASLLALADGASQEDARGLLTDEAKAFLGTLQGIAVQANEILPAPPSGTRYV